MLEMASGAVAVIGGWFTGGAGAVRILEPATWSPGFWALVGALAMLVLLASLRRRSREPLRVRPPQMLVTRGELVPDQGSGSRRGDAGTLTMTVSNLSRYPVQILEVAVNTGGERQFGVTEVSALVPAMGEVDVATRLPVGRLDDGTLDVFAYAAATRVKTYRHRAELVWEPWAKRFKVAPLEQRIVPARVLPSTRHDAIRLPEDVGPPHGIRAASPAPIAPRRVPSAPVRPSGSAERAAPSRAPEPGTGPRPHAPGGASDLARPGAPLEDLRDLGIDEGITPLPARSAALERRDAAAAARRPGPPRVDDNGGADRSAPGPADLFALLGDGARHGAAPGGTAPTTHASEPERAAASDAPRRATPAHDPDLDELLVSDLELVAHDALDDDGPDVPYSGAEARARRHVRARSGAIEREIRTPELPEPAAEPMRPARPEPRRSDVRRSRAPERPSDDLRDARLGDEDVPDAERHTGDADGSGPTRFDDDRLAPRRDRGPRPLEFPEEF